jgi:hypothetical protein
MCQVFQSFCHESDAFTFTTRKQIWLHDLSQTVDDKTIIPLLTKDDVEKFSHLCENVFGVCTDYPASL